MSVPSDKVGLFGNSRKIQVYLSFGLFVLPLVFGFIHATKGLDLTDEGMYISTSLRYSLGDIPFRDEIMNVTRPFDVLLSPIFRIFPNISLLQWRCVGLLLQVSGLVLLFIFFSRFVPPFVVSLACSSVFFLSDFNNILTPSYNTISRDFSLIAVALWLNALATSHKARRIFLPVLGGIFFSLSAISYPPLFLLMAIPLSLVLISLVVSTQRNSLKPSTIFLTTVLACLAIFMIVVAAEKLLPEAIKWAQEVSKTNPVRIQGPFQKALHLLQDFINIAPKGLLLWSLSCLALFLIRLKSKKMYLARSLFSLLFLLTAFSLLLINNLQLLSLSYVIFSSVFFLFFRDNEVSIPTGMMRWIYVRNIAIAWGLLTVLIYGISSDNALYASLMGIILLFITLMMSIFRFGNQDGPVLYSNKMRNISGFLIVFTLITPFLFIGSVQYISKSYREPKVASLTQRFKSPRLSGIFSTPEKVQAIESVLGYLQGKIIPGDFFLAYNHIPLFYYLTHTRPVYPATWAKDEWPKSLNQRLVDQMIQNNRNAEYCLRMLVEPWDWNTRMVYDDYSPLGIFINNNYYMEKILYPFEILRRGPGPKLKKFIPDLGTLFFNWQGKAAVPMKDLPNVAPPLSILGARGDFVFENISENNEKTIRITPITKDEKEGIFILFLGYWVNKNGLEIPLEAGQMAYFDISMRMSQMTNKPTEVLIMDKKGDWQRNVYTADVTFWKQYHVDRKIRDGAEDLLFGIYWQPENNKEWLEIKNPRFYLIK